MENARNLALVAKAARNPTHKDQQGHLQYMTDSLNMYFHMNMNIPLLQLSANDVNRPHQNLMFEQQEFFTFVLSVNSYLASMLLFDYERDNALINTIFH